MKKNKIIICIAVIVLVLICLIIFLFKKDSTKIITDVGEEMEYKIDISKDDLSIAFLKIENNKKNMIYSPLSIKYALQMLDEGADGETKKQIEDVIKNINLTNYDNIKNKLSFANAIYIRENYYEEISKDYIQLLDEKYNAEVLKDDFSNAKSINKWIEEQTLGKIKNMISDDILKNPNTVMALINALAIDMEWKNPFDETITSGQPFYIENGKEITVETMVQNTYSDKTFYLDNDDVTAVSMELEKCDDVELEFIAIMPKNNLSEYINSFSEEKLNNTIDKLEPASEAQDGIKLFIPKFSFSYDLELKNDLINLGIKDAFSIDNANFSKMSTNNKDNLYVGQALHKADIELSEDGVKAAAATSAIMLTKSSIPAFEPDPIIIRIDNPFLYVIRDINTGEIWFIGTVYEPNIKNNN